MKKNAKLCILVETTHLGTTPLKETAEKKYLGVLITNNLKPLRQATKTAASSNSMVGLQKKP